MSVIHVFWIHACCRTKWNFDGLAETKLLGLIADSLLAQFDAELSKRNVARESKRIGNRDSGLAAALALAAVLNEGVGARQLVFGWIGQGRLGRVLATLDSCRGDQNLEDRARRIERATDRLVDQRAARVS